MPFALWDVPILSGHDQQGLKYSILTSKPLEATLDFLGTV